MPEIFSSSRPKSAKSTPKRKVAATEEVVHEPVDPEIIDQPVEKPRRTEEKRKGRHVDEYSAVMRSLSPTRNPFTSFAPKPYNTAFDAQHEEEQVLLVLRQSLITQIKYVFIIIGLLLVPLLFNSVGMLDFLPLRFQLVANIGWYLIVASYALEVFLSWFYNVYIITDERIIDVDFNSILFKNVAYAKIDNIEDITATTAGALGSIFDFGDVRIQTAGAVTQFEFENVPHPSKVVAFLNELIIEEENEKQDHRSH